MAISAMYAQSAEAAQRRCTASERSAADRQLWLNERDRSYSLLKNLPWGLPQLRYTPSGESLYAQRDYVIWYDADLRVPLFTAERVDAHRLKKVPRTDCFRPDPRIKSVEASAPSDYDEPIFDQGHLAAFANQDTSQIAGNNSFIMSNMVPQNCQFNRGIWQILEGLTRQWAGERKTVFVISGSIFDRDGDHRRDHDTQVARMRARNGSARVAIPTAFFKVIVEKRPDGTHSALSLVLPHNQENPNEKAALTYLSSHISTLANIEALTGFRFTPETETIDESVDLWPVDMDNIPNSLCSARPRDDFDSIWDQ
jgi:endonuclease G